ncbi:MAG: tetratricopeptide repeat protein [Bernardetiaceae bacterium]|nr:tetratricopeptide repeat protein [Bernardetiaceae bacterium]
MCILFLFCYSVPLQAQAKLPAFEEALRAYKAKQYADAVLILENILSQHRQDEQALYYAALCYLHLQQPATAYEYLKMIPKGQAVFLNDYYYWLGKSAYLSHKFEESKTAIDSYLTEKGNKKFFQDASHLLTQLEYVAEIASHPSPFVVESPQGINTAVHESIPISLPDRQRFWFMRRKKGDKKTDYEQEGWLLVQKQPDGKWTKVTTEKEQNEYVFLQWVENERAMLSLKAGKLYIVQPTSTGWQPLRELKVAFREASRPLAATLYEQGKKLIFSAFNPESGSLDLFYTELKADGTWSFPSPLTEINTNRDEYTPFFADDSKTLYFSSKGWKNIGGFDLFKTQYDPVKKRWTTPENLGFPINSASDDYWLQIYNERGFFASNRAGGKGGDDIYFLMPLSKIQVNGKISSKNGQAIANAIVQFTYHGKTIQLRTDATGHYKTELPTETEVQLRVWQQGKIQYQETFRLHHEGSAKSVVKNFNMQAEIIAKDTTNPAKSETSAEVIFAINGLVRDATNKQPLRATIRLIDLETTRTVKFTSTDAQGRFNFYLDKPINAYFIEVSSRGFFSHWQLGEYIGKEEYNVWLQPIAAESVWQISVIEFEPRSDQLRPSSLAILDKLGTFLLENGNIKVQVRCPDGSLKLGQKRSTTIVNYLVQKGIASYRLSMAVLPNSSSQDKGIELSLLP